MDDKVWGVLSALFKCSAREKVNEDPHLSLYPMQEEYMEGLHRLTQDPKLLRTLCTLAGADWKEVSHLLETDAQSMEIRSLSYVDSFEAPSFLRQHTGSVAELIRKIDWAKTPLGPVKQWPQSLRTSVDICLASKFPMAVLWGPELVLLYNEAYIPVFGNRHPQGLGHRFCDVWAEIWEDFQPMFHEVFIKGEATWSEDQLLFMTRHNYLEECYFTWSYSPIRNEKGTIDGCLAPVSENTGRVLSERRLRTLRSVSDGASKVNTYQDACTQFLNSLKMNTNDIPFALLYMHERYGERSIFKLSGHVGFENENHPAVLSKITESMGDSLWPVFKVLQTKKSIEMDDIVSRFGDLPGGAWPESPSHAVVMPINDPTDGFPGVVILGINPRREYDRDYSSFFTLLTDQLGNTIASVKTYLEEKERAKQLAEINNAKTIFFTNISHEFRTPLSLILSPLETIIKQEKEAPSMQSSQLSMISMVHRNAQRLHKLVNNLLDFSRIEAGRMKTFLQPTNLNKMTADLVSMFRAAVERAGLQLHIDFPNEDATVHVDRGMWEKIVLNLLSNALKYTIKGHINVSLRYKLEEDGLQYAEFAVEDTGIGIPEKELPLIFERFHRVDGSHGRSHEGSGIGLSLTLELAKLHGRRMSATSEFGKGSTFTVFIPIAPLTLSPLSPTHHQRLFSEEEEEEADNQPVQPSNLSKQYVDEILSWMPIEKQTISPPKYGHEVGSALILYADDNADMREYVTTLLSAVPLWHIRSVVDGVEALQAVQEFHPDLVLTDAMMPKMDGFELIKRLRANAQTENIPIVMLSARAGAEAKTGGIHAGADDYLAKPFNANELIARVEKHIAIGRRRKELNKMVEERTEELAASEHRYRILATYAPVGVVQLDESGERVAYCNDKYCQMVGMCKEELTTSRKWEEALHPQSRHIVSEWYKSVAAHASYSTEVCFRRNDGTEVWALVEANITPHAAEKKPVWVATLMDITERKKLQQERIDAIQHAEAVQRQRATDAEFYRKQLESFVDTMSHEIRNPLNGILNNSDLLQINLRKRGCILLRAFELVSAATNSNPQFLSAMQAELDSLNAQLPDDKESIDAILSCAQHQQVITNDILHLSRLESGQVVIASVPFSPASVVESALCMFSVEMALQNISLTTQLPPASDMLQGDPDRLCQVLVNLISNAVKFTQECPVRHIKVSLEIQREPASTPTISNGTTDKKAVLHVCVSDTGVGMSQEEQARVFNRFSSTEKKIQKYGGSGLGLYICKAILERMGGGIQVTSKEQSGTSFTFTVTCLEIPPTMQIDKQQILLKSTEIFNKKKYKILIVEDNSVNQKILKRHLELDGHSCTVADNGKIALNQMETKEFDLIFMDIEMPIMDGITATKLIRTRESEGKRTPVPILGLSGNARQQQIDEAMQAGMQAFIVKPYQKQQLLAAVQEHAR